MFLSFRGAPQEPVATTIRRQPAPLLLLSPLAMWAEFSDAFY